MSETTIETKIVKMLNNENWRACLRLISKQGNSTSIPFQLALIKLHCYISLHNEISSERLCQKLLKIEPDHMLLKQISKMDFKEVVTRNPLNVFVQSFIQFYENDVHQSIEKLVFQTITKPSIK